MDCSWEGEYILINQSVKYSNHLNQSLHLEKDVDDTGVGSSLD